MSAGIGHRRGSSFQVTQVDPGPLTFIGNKKTWVHVVEL